MMQRTAQVIVFLKADGSIGAEAPSSSGARRKIELEEGWELATLRAELLAQRDRFVSEEADRRQREAEENSARRGRVIRTIRRDHGDRPHTERLVSLIAKSATPGLRARADKPPAGL